MNINNKFRLKITYWCLFFFMIIHPFFFMDKYFHISINKMGCFLLFGVILIFLVASNIIIDSEPLEILKELIKNWGFCEWAMVVFLITNVISLLVSDYTAESFLGGNSRNHGFANYLFYALLFIVIRRGLTRNASLSLIKVMTIVGAAANIFAICQYLEFDPLGMYDGVALRSKLSMISPIGNMNTYSSYLNIVVPLAIFLFITSKGIKDCLIWGICIALGAIGGVVSTSDSFYFCIIITPALLLLSGILTKRELIRMPLAVAIASFADAILITIANAMTKSGVDIRPGSGITAYLNAHTGLLFIIAIVALIVWLPLFMFIKKNLDEILIPASARRVLIGIFFGALAIAVIVWILGFPYKDEMGSYRGFIWNLSIKDFKASNLVTKLFGHGQETIYDVFINKYYNEMVSTTGVVYDNVHSEPLQYLLTLGIVGLCSYIALVGGIMYKLVKSVISGNKAALLFLLPTLCYFAQGFVNIAQSATTPLFFILLMMGVNHLQPDMPESIKSLEAQAKS